MLRKIIKIVATRCHILKLKCTKFVFGRGSAPDPAGGAYDAPSEPLVGWGGGHPLSIPHPLDAFGVSASTPQSIPGSAFSVIRPLVIVNIFYLSSCLSYDTISPLFNVKRNLLIFIKIQDRNSQ